MAEQYTGHVPLYCTAIGGISGQAIRTYKKYYELNLLKIEIIIIKLELE